MTDADDPRLRRVRGALSEDEYLELVTMLRNRRDVPRRDPGPTSPGPGRDETRSRATPRRQFGTTWWGRAWVDALEQRARLDPNRLPRGRTYARQNRVLRLDVEPGEASAFVQGSRARPYRVQLHVRRFSPDEWDRVLDAIAAKAAHAAALLDGELDPGVLSDAEAAGADLLPGPGDLSPSCTCPDWADPCKHAAAVCYLVADALDDDPFNLLLLRGLPRNEVLAAVRTRRQLADPAATTAAPAPPEGVRASVLFGERRDPPDRELIAQLGRVPLGSQPGRPAPLAVDPPQASGISADDLAELAADAARRAHAMLTDGLTSRLELPSDLDLIRRSAEVLSSPNAPADGAAHLARIAQRAGRPTRELERDALAWLHGGEEALSVLHERWQPEPDQLREGRDALRVDGQPVRALGNRLTRGRMQLRLARSGRWYRLDNHAGEWEIDRPGRADPTELL